MSGPVMGVRTVLSGSLVAFMFSASQRGMQGTFAVTGTLRAGSSEWLMEFELI
jgi:hypothetical protein